jgi:hypothetical protein
MNTISMILFYSAWWKTLSQIKDDNFKVSPDVCQHPAMLTRLLGVQLLQQSPINGRVSLFKSSFHGSSFISNRSLNLDCNITIKFTNICYMGFFQQSVSILHCSNMWHHAQKHARHFHSRQPSEWTLTLEVTGSPTTLVPTHHTVPHHNSNNTAIRL